MSLRSSFDMQKLAISRFWKKKAASDPEPAPDQESESESALDLESESESDSESEAESESEPEPPRTSWDYKVKRLHMRPSLVWVSGPPLRSGYGYSEENINEGTSGDIAGTSKSFRFGGLEGARVGFRGLWTRWRAVWGLGRGEVPAEDEGKDTALMDAEARELMDHIDAMIASRRS